MSLIFAALMALGWIAFGVDRNDPSVIGRYLIVSPLSDIFNDETQFACSKNVVKDIFIQNTCIIIDYDLFFSKSVGGGVSYIARTGYKCFALTKVRGATKFSFLDNIKIIQGWGVGVKSDSAFSIAVNSNSRTSPGISPSHLYGYPVYNILAIDRAINSSANFYVSFREPRPATLDQRRSRHGILLSEFKRFIGISGGALSGQNGFARIVERNNDRPRTKGAYEQRPKSKISRIASGVRSFPLGAKVGIALVLSVLAAGILHNGLNGIADRRSDRIGRLLRIGLALALYASLALFWAISGGQILAA